MGSRDRVLPLASFRGTTRPVLLAGSKAYLQKAQAAAEPLREVSWRLRGQASCQVLQCFMLQSGYDSCLATYFRNNMMLPFSSPVATSKSHPQTMPTKILHQSAIHAQALRERGVSLVPLPSTAAEEDDPTERLRALKREFQCVSVWLSNCRFSGAESRFLHAQHLLLA